MGWKKTFLLTGAGVLTGYLLQKQLDSQTNISPERALKCVKRVVREKYNIDGSWVHMQVERVERHGLDFDVYRGGITVSTDEQVKHFNFLVDANTGTVLEFTPDD